LFAILAEVTWAARPSIFIAVTFLGEKGGGAAKRTFTTESDFVKKKLKKLAAGLAVAVMGLLPMQAKAWTVTDLGDLGMSGFGYPMSINNSGQITGQSRTAGGDWHAFLYSGGTMTDIGTLGGNLSQGRSINEAGTVAGLSYCSGSIPQHPFTYAGGTMTDLFTGAMTMQSGLALSINNSGDVLLNARLLYSGGTFTDLTTLGMTVQDEPIDLNDKGQIVGKSHNSVTGYDSAFVYQGGTLTLLPRLGGDYAQARAINSMGQVVGYSKIAGNAYNHGFVWTPTVPNGTTGTIVDIGVLPGYGDLESYITDINSWGTAVGYSNGGGTDQDPFMYTECGGMVPLNTLISWSSGWTLRKALCINDKGQIIGIGDHSSAGWGDRFFLLSP
jgi:probable HAF family extracellular repeat protein